MSGATKRKSSASATRIRRRLPTPGSTTARWIVPAGKAGAAAASRNEAVSRSPGGTS